MIKKIIKHSAFLLIGISTLNIFLPDSSIKVDGNPFFKSETKELFKQNIRQDVATLELLRPNLSNDVNIFVQENNTLYDYISNLFYQDREKLLTINGESSFFSTSRYEFSETNNIVLGTKMDKRFFPFISGSFIELELGSIRNWARARLVNFNEARLGSARLGSTR